MNNNNNNMINLNDVQQISRTKKQKIMNEYININKRKTKSRIVYKMPLIFTSPLFKTNLFKLENSVPDGNCLFESIHKVLLSYNLSKYNIDGLNHHLDITVKGLRDCVSNSINNDQFTFLKEIYDYALKNKDLGVLHDYDFMNGVNNLQQLKKIINTSNYWGDDMALDAIEHQYKSLRFIVIKEEHNELKICQRLQKNDDSMGCVFLYLKNKHYQLITIDGYYIDKNKYMKNSLFVIWPRQLIHQLTNDNETLKSLMNVVYS